MNWSLGIFKGRMGEAIVESVLLEFGYKVKRIGQEHQKDTGGKSSEYNRVAPDLLVIDPRSNKKTYVEVKLRSARPMTVLLEKQKLEKILRYYPETVLIFVSAYNGSVNCASVAELESTNRVLRKDGNYELDLFGEEWKPIWYYFPLVKTGHRLTSLWESVCKRQRDNVPARRAER